MKYFISSILIFLFSTALQAQKVESIHFHLYTDSLKKGTHNYINVDGKLSGDNWMPLTAKELEFSSDYGKFDGNDLILPDEPAVKKVTVKATLKTDKKQSKQITIWIKQTPDPPLPKESSFPGKRTR
ncbi:hypothetical protein ABDK00_015590 [Niabella insulamsoli]|uniref:hypothetical protein n=1 Tax=Niabella insulamsoli TaxID=3144874 RepID=UPI0031FE2574